MGHFRPIELIVFVFQFKHHPEHGFRSCFLFGVIIIVNGEGGGKGGYIHHQFQCHHHRQRQSCLAAADRRFRQQPTQPGARLRFCRLLRFFLKGELQHGFFRQLRRFQLQGFFHSLCFLLFRQQVLMPIEHQAQIQSQESEIEHQKCGIFDFLLVGQQQRHAHGGSGQDLPDFYLIPQKPGTISHIQQHKAKEEAEAVRDLIGKMEAVPNIVQLANEEAAHKKQQQHHAADFVPDLHRTGQQEQHCQCYGENAAIQIGKAIDIGRCQAACHLAGYGLHTLQHRRDGCPNGSTPQRKQFPAYRSGRFLLGGLKRIPRISGNRHRFAGDHIDLKSLGEFIDAGVGILQRSQRRQLQNRCHTDGQYRKYTDAEEILQTAPHTLKSAQLIAEKQQQHENADKKAYIVVRQNGQRQGDGIQHIFFIPQ